MILSENESYTIGHLQHDDDVCVMHLNGFGQQVVSKDDVDAEVWTELISSDVGDQIELQDGVITGIRL